MLKIFKFFLILKKRSKIIKSGDFFSKPSKRQFKIGLSSLIVFDVVSKQSYFDLKKFAIFRDFLFVIQRLFLFIVKKSFEIANLPSVNGSSLDDCVK